MQAINMANLTLIQGGALCKCMMKSNEMYHRTFLLNICGMGCSNWCCNKNPGDRWLLDQSCFGLVKWHKCDGDDGALVIKVVDVLPRTYIL